MNDKAKIFAGLAVFVLAVTLPIWMGLVTAKGEKPDPILPTQSSACVESKEYMVANHMNMLDTWRDAVIREGHKEYKATDGTEYEMSLTKTCMSAKCHADKATFCDECHEYANVEPYCWDCHVEPKGE